MNYLTRAPRCWKAKLHDWQGKRIIHDDDDSLTTEETCGHCGLVRIRSTSRSKLHRGSTRYRMPPAEKGP